MEPTQTQQDAASGTPLSPEEGVSNPGPQSKNTVFVAVIAVIVVVLGLIYVWTTSLTSAPATVPPEPTPPVTSEPAATGTQDDLDTIERDLSMPDLETLDSGVDRMQAEVDAGTAATAPATAAPAQ